MASRLISILSALARRCCRLRVVNDRITILVEIERPCQAWLLASSKVVQSASMAAIRPASSLTPPRNDGEFAQRRKQARISLALFRSIQIPTKAACHFVSQADHGGLCFLQGFVAPPLLLPRGLQRPSLPSSERALSSAALSRSTWAISRSRSRLRSSDGALPTAVKAATSAERCARKVDLCLIAGSAAVLNLTEAFAQACHALKPIGEIFRSKVVRQAAEPVSQGAASSLSALSRSSGP